MVWIYMTAGESIKANFILIGQNIQFIPVYCATKLLSILSKTTLHTLFKGNLVARKLIKKPEG